MDIAWYKEETILIRLTKRISKEAYDIVISKKLCMLKKNIIIIALQNIIL